MGLACKIVRTDSGVLALNEQGKVSNLYLDLLSFFQNDEKALNFWALTHTDEFKTAFGGRSDNMSVEDVVAFANAVQIEESELSPSERHEVKSIMESNNIGDLQQLSNTLNNIFKPNGFIDLDIDAAIESGMYNQEDLKNINLTEINSLLNKIEGDLQKGRNFTVVPSQDDVAVIDETKKTILGTSFQLSRTDIDNDIIPRIESFTPDVIEEAIQNSEFQTYVDKFNTDEEFKNKEIERFSKLSSVPVLSFIGDQITDENISYHDQLLNTIPAEFDIVDIESDLDFIEEIPAENWVNNPNEIINVLREAEQTLAKNNIDLVGLSNLYNNREQVLSLITPLKNMIRNTNDVTILEFARAHDTVFPPSENRLVRVIPEKYKGLNVVSLNTRKTDAELYREHGLIKLEEGLYHKVQRMDNTMAAYEYLYRQLVDGKMTIPSQYITVKDYKNPSNKVEVLKGITNYVNARETGITSEFQEEISLYQLVFDHNPIQKQDFRKLSTIRTNEEYLKGDFVADFYNYVLNEKLNDTPMYREVLSKFKFTNADIVIDGYISSLDGINMQQELEDYLKLKNGTSYEFLFNNGEGYLLEDFEAVNNPESVQPYKGEIVKDGDYVITNPQSDMFVNYDGQLYRKVGKSLNADLYLKISEVSRPVYNTAEANFEYNREEARAMLDAYQNGIDSQKISFQEFNERLEKAETSPTAVLFQKDAVEKVEEKPIFTPTSLFLKDYDGMFSTKTTGLSFYDDILNADTEKPGYQFFYKGIQARIEMMSPSEYLRRVREGFNTQVDENLTESSRKKIMDAVEKGDKIDMPFLRYDNGSFSQEGRNRANLARELGESNIPVLVVTNVKQEDKIKKAQEFIDSVSSEKINTTEDLINTLKSEYNLHRDAINFISNRLSSLKPSSVLFQRDTADKLSQTPQDYVNQTIEDIDNLTEGESIQEGEITITKDGDSYVRYREGTDKRSPHTLNLNRYEAIVSLNNYRAKTTRVGENIKLRDYKTEKIKGHELNVGDVYVRTQFGVKYVFKMLSKPTRSKSDGRFWNVDVEVLSIGNQPVGELVYSIERKLEVSPFEKVVGKKTIDTFKSPSSSYIVFGNVTKINNWEEITPMFQVRNNQDNLNLRPQTKPSPKIITDAVLTKLQETGLANKVFAMTSKEINAKLEEIGLTEEVRKQIIAWHGTQNPAKNLKKKDFKNQIKYGDLLSGTYFGNKTIAAGFSGIFQGSTLFKAKIDEAGFETIDMKKTTPMGTEELIEVIGQERYDDLLAKKNNGEIKGIILENTYEKNYPIGTTTQYLVFDPQTITVLDKYVGDRLEEEVMDSFGIAYDPKNLSFSTESLTVTPNGFVYNGDVYLNTDNPRILNTQIHEFGHLFNFWAKENRPNLYRKGIQLVQEQGQEYIDKVKESQPNLEGERLYEEALTQLIGDKGELVVNKERKSAIGQWLTDLWNSIKNALGITQYTADELENITLEEFAEAIAVDMLKGTKFQTSEYTIQPLLDEMFAKKKGKMVNVQTINQILNQPTTKAIEKEIIREVLNLEGFRGKTQIPFDEFKGEVNARIMPLDVIESNTYSDQGIENVGVDVGFHSTNIYNSKLDHQIDGHFEKDFDQSYYRRNLDGIKFNIYSVYEENGSEMHYVLDYSVDPGFKITPENKDGKAYFISPSLEMANNWIENYNKTRKINSGQFGHTRVWREAGTKDVYVAEMQSDSYQKVKAIDMVLTNYENNPQDLNSKQKLIYKKIKETENLINDFDSSDLGTEEYKVKKLYTKISLTLKSISEDKQAIKNLKKSIEKAKQENRPFDSIERQIDSVQDRIKEKEKDLKQMMSLVTDEKIGPIKSSNYDFVYYKLPFLTITLDKSKRYRLEHSSRYWLMLTTKDESEIFYSLDDAVSYYEKNILPRIKPDKQLYTKYFNAKKDLPNLKNSLLDNASLRDKQFIAHRKNYTERLLREEIKRNAELGMETLAIPTPRTLALIEGYVSAYDLGLQPYNIVSSRNTDKLENGDIIKYLGEYHTVFNANSTNFKAVITDNIKKFNIYDFVNQEANRYAGAESRSLFFELNDKDLFTKESWDEYKESSDYEYLLPELEDISELIDEETETYRLDKDIMYDAIKEYYFYFIQSEGISKTLENQGYTVLYEDDSTVYTTGSNAYLETLQQPDQYAEAASVEEFTMEDIKEDYQGILKRYEKTIDLFKKERGENIETITDSKGNEWVRTKLTSEDAISPVIAFQIEMPSVKNIPNIISNKKSDIATTIESSFEMLTPTEEETRNKVECQS